MAKVVEKENKNKSIIEAVLRCLIPTGLPKSAWRRMPMKLESYTLRRFQTSGEVYFTS